jgi:vitamin B12/bleomycin/antimicrobial peptide transport system ATP-binding/permease protein
VLVYVLVQLNEWNRVFYDALQNRDEAVFWEQIKVFCMLAGAFIVVAVYRFYLTQFLAIRWRTWMTRDFLKRWTTHQIFYQIELRQSHGLGDGLNGSDNPDQRIQEDIKMFTEQTVDLSMGLLEAVATLSIFIGILWVMSGGFTFVFQGDEYTVHGYMVWMALLYCVGGSLIGHFLGRRMAPLNFAQQRLEADFRHHLIRVREYSEAIAMDRGAAYENQSLQKRFMQVVTNFKQLLSVQKRFTWFSSGYGQAAVVFPILVAAPRYFAGTIQLGELMQISSAFGRVQDALSWIITNYSNLAAWTATTHRLSVFSVQMETLRAISFAVVQPLDPDSPSATELKTSADHHAARPNRLARRCGFASASRRFGADSRPIWQRQIHACCVCWQAFGPMCAAGMPSTNRCQFRRLWCCLPMPCSSHNGRISLKALCAMLWLIPMPTTTTPTSN